MLSFIGYVGLIGGTCFLLDSWFKNPTTMNLVAATIIVAVSALALLVARADRKKQEAKKPFNIGDFVTPPPSIYQRHFTPSAPAGLLGAVTCIWLACFAVACATIWKDGGRQLQDTMTWVVVGMIAFLMLIFRMVRAASNDSGYIAALVNTTIWFIVVCLLGTFLGEILKLFSWNETGLTVIKWISSVPFILFFLINKIIGEKGSEQRAKFNAAMGLAAVAYGAHVAAQEQEQEQEQDAW